MNPLQNTASSSTKQAAKQCFVMADTYIKELKFVEARQEIEKAKKIDPTNAYIHAFLDRIAYFEQQKKKEAPSQAAPATPVKKQAVPQSEPAGPQPATAKISPVPAPPLSPPAVNVSSAAPPPSSASPVHQIPPQPTQAATPATVSPAVPQPSGSARPKDEVDVKLDEMKRQIDMLTHALDQEKKAREEMTKQQSQVNIEQLRAALEKAWENGAPNEADAEELRQLAIKIGISETVEQTLRREVKLKLYGQAVKEVISKRTLLRSSSQTLEWLRKVYQVTVQEYLEYESKFLLDLVADQYKGTLLYVSSDAMTKDLLVPRLKTAGYAVVLGQTPEDALEKIEKINPNLILCHMEFGPGSLSGIKFLQLIRATSKFNFIPFILICAPDDVGVIKSSELRANEAYIETPVDADELTSMMNEKLIQLREYISNLN